MANAERAVTDIREGIRNAQGTRCDDRPEVHRRQIFAGLIRIWKAPIANVIGSDKASIGSPARFPRTTVKGEDTGGTRAAEPALLTDGRRHGHPLAECHRRLLGGAIRAGLVNLNLIPVEYRLHLYFRIGIADLHPRFECLCRSGPVFAKALLIDVSITDYNRA